MEYTLVLPTYFDAWEGEIEAKGFFADALIEVSGQRYRPVFYSHFRFSQELADWLASNHAFSERNVVILREVNRATIEAAVAELSSTGFHGIEPEAD